jgi:predicted transcriptional regulator
MDTLTKEQLLQIAKKERFPWITAKMTKSEIIKSLKYWWLVKACLFIDREWNQ